MTPKSLRQHFFRTLSVVGALMLVFFLGILLWGGWMVTAKGMAFFEEHLATLASRQVAEYKDMFDLLEENGDALLLRFLEDLKMHYAEEGRLPSEASDEELASLMRRFVRASGTSPFDPETFRYYLIDPKGRVARTNHSPDLGLDLSQFTRLWRTLRTMVPGEVRLQRATSAIMTDDYNKYAYWKLRDGTILEVSVSVPRKHMDKYLEKIRGMLGFPFVNSLAFASLATRRLETGDPALTTSEDWALIREAGRGGKERLLLRDGLLKRRLLLYVRPPGEDNVVVEEPKLLLLSLDFTLLGKLFGAFLLGILFLLLAGVGGLSIAFGRIVDTLTTPFERLARNMAALAANPEEFAPDQNLKSSSVTEIQELLDTFRSMAAKLGATMEEREAALQQARALYGETRILNDELEHILGVAGRLTSEATSGEETFLPELLHMALQFIPEADCGSISEVNGEEWRIVDAVGHNAECLRTLPLKRTHLRVTKGTSVVPCLCDDLDRRMPPPLAEKFRTAVLPIRQSLLHSFFLDEEMVGQICLDISQRRSEASAFSLRSERVLTAFGNMASAYLGIRRYVATSSSFQKQLVSVMIGILEIYDHYTKGHSENVAQLASRLAAALDMDETDISRIYWTGLLHDLGKLLVPVTVLNKPGPLEEAEYEVIKMHPRWGYAVLSSSANLEEIARDVLHHHERWDGKGYPEGISGEAIPLGARILSVADAFDAMTSCRSYRPAMEKDEALRELEQHRGTQFDPAVVDVALRILP